MIKIAKELKFNPKAYVQHYGMSTPDFRKGLGKDIEYVFGISYWTENMKIQSPGLFKNPKEYARCHPEEIQCRSRLHRGGLHCGRDWPFRKPFVRSMPSSSHRCSEGCSHRRSGETGHRKRSMGASNSQRKANFTTANAGLESITLQYQGGKLTEVGPPKTRVAAPKYPTPPWDKR